VEEKPVNFSTTLSANTKMLLERFCKNRGIKMNHFVEAAILESLEDQLDVEVANQRDGEKLVDWKKT